MIPQENCEPRISDYNENGLLNLEGILDICENAASHHSAKASFDVIAKRMDGITWVLAEWNVCILHRPKSGERLHISTWVREENVTTTTNRDLVVKNDAGDDCILAKAKFVLFDMQTRRPTRISPEILAAFQPENATSMDFDTAHLQEPSCYEREITLALRRTDADFNGHIHNYFRATADGNGEKAQVGAATTFVTTSPMGLKFDEYGGEIDDLLDFQTGGQKDERQYITCVEVTAEGLTVTAYQRTEAGDANIKNCGDYTVIDRFTIAHAKAEAAEEPTEAVQTAEEPQTTEKKDLTGLWIVLGAVAAVLIVGTVVFVLRRKKKTA